jgi:hypothetical protein
MNRERKRTLRQVGYKVIKTAYGFQPATPDGLSIIRGWCADLGSALDHCWDHYEATTLQPKAKKVIAFGADHHDEIE